MLLHQLSPVCSFFFKYTSVVPVSFVSCHCVLLLLFPPAVIIFNNCLITRLRVCVHMYMFIDRLELEKEVAELRVQLCKASVLSEVEDLKRAVDHKEKERVQLSLKVEVCIKETVRQWVLLFYIKQQELITPVVQRRHCMSFLSHPCYSKEKNGKR